MVVREDARQLAMLSVWGMLAGGIKSYDQILNATQIQCKIVNHYVISAERREFEEEFRREVLDRLDLLPI
jgi:50S ribosomal subunit-associated GTPase HflX